MNKGERGRWVGPSRDPLPKFRQIAQKVGRDPTSTKEDNRRRGNGTLSRDGDRRGAGSSGEAGLGKLAALA
jgi:hypothetical protein